MIYEYGIAHWRHDPNGPMEEEQGPHRENMTLNEAVEWLDGWKKDGGKTDAFFIIRRPKGPWERLREIPEGESVPRRIRSRKEKEQEDSRQEGLTTP